MKETLPLMTRMPLIVKVKPSALYQFETVP